MNNDFLFGAMGDSITTGFNAESASDNLIHSWATGAANVGSHKDRLERVFPGLKVVPVNAAVAGARADALVSQVTRLLAVGVPDYVTILIGANDLHAWLMSGEYGAALAQFKRNVEDAVRRLVAANGRLMIVLSGIPDQSRVLALALRASGGPAARLLAELPPALLASLQGGYGERWNRANEALATVAAAFPSNMRFVTKTPRVRFAPEHLSTLDFYHPSVAGQKLLADVTWEQGWFP